MYLKQIEIHGFKSFAEKIELNLENSINAVVGPNGSGKSNISDAIRWVLGEQSAKTLRGSKMEDIIFAGSEKKKALGFAQVSLCIDNTDKRIPVDYTEINVMRRIYRSGDSEYYINKTQCRLKDIYEIFMDTGIGKDGYSIIGQGRIDEILSNKSDERRLVFEEAAGIVKYKSRKNEAEKKLEQTKQNIIRVNDIIEEIEGQLEPLSEQAEIARRYRLVLEELKKIEVNMFIGNIEKHRMKLQELKIEESSLGDMMQHKMLENRRIEASFGRLKEQIAGLDRDIEKLNEVIYSNITLNEKNEGHCNLLKEKISNLNEYVEKLKERRNELVEEHSNSENTITINIKKLEELNKVYEDISESIVQRLLDNETKYNSMTKMEMDLENKQQMLIEHINSNSETKSKINSINSFIENINKRTNQINIDINILNNQKSEKANQSKDIENLIQSYMEQKSQLNELLEDLTQSKRQCEICIKELEVKSSNTKSSMDSTMSRLKVLEEMERDFGGYSKAVKSLLKKAKTLTDSFCGAVGELIEVPSEYVVAIEIALGASIQSVITDTENNAKTLIEYLKTNNLGRATFLPINTIKPRYFGDKERTFFTTQGFIGIGADLVKCESKISNIVRNLLGRTAIVKDMDSAIKLARVSGHTFKIVTLSGEVINAGGAITGGSTGRSSSSVLSRKNEIVHLKSTYEKIKSENSNISINLAREKANIEKYSLDIKQKVNDIHNLEIILNDNNNKYNNIKNDIQLSNDRISIFNTELKELYQENDENKKNIDKYKGKFEALEIQKTELDKEITDYQNQIKVLKEAKDAYNKEITDLKVNKAGIEQNRKSLTSSNHELQQKLSKYENNIDDNKKEEEQSLNQINGLNIELRDKKLEINNITQKIESYKIQLQEKDNNKNTKIQEGNNLEEKIKEYGIEISHIQSNLHKIEMQYAKAEVELQNIELKLLDTYELNFYNAQELRDESITLSWATKKCDELKSEIRKMGSVNVNAVEEYDKISQRYEFLNSQVNDLVNGRDSLIKVIDEICESMKKQFVEEFEKINNNFNEVFAQLFGGGHAQLILSDEQNILESGIEIIAKPPGKKLQNLMLLSGGERALTAIALLFAILKMKPAPFCVLDEIDAALDDANVDRYAKFLKEFAKTTQFILVTHRKGSMEAADCLYGVSMEDSGISKLVSVKLENKE